MGRPSTFTPTSCRRDASRITAPPRLRQARPRTPIASLPQRRARSALSGWSASGPYLKGEDQLARRHKRRPSARQPVRAAAPEGRRPYADPTASSTMRIIIRRRLPSTQSSAARAADSALRDQDPLRQPQPPWRPAEVTPTGPRHRMSRTADRRRPSRRCRPGHRHPCRLTRPGMDATTLRAATQPSTHPTRARSTRSSRTCRRSVHHHRLP